MLAAEKERKAGRPDRGSPVLAMMMRKIFDWRAMERRAKEEPLGSGLTIKTRGSRGGSLSEILIKLYKGRREGLSSENENHSQKAGREADQ